MACAPITGICVYSATWETSPVAAFHSRDTTSPHHCVGFQCFAKCVTNPSDFVLAFDLFLVFMAKCNCAHISYSPCSTQWLNTVKCCFYFCALWCHSSLQLWSIKTSESLSLPAGFLQQLCLDTFPVVLTSLTHLSYFCFLFQLVPSQGWMGKVSSVLWADTLQSTQLVWCQDPVPPPRHAPPAPLHNAQAQGVTLLIAHPNPQQAAAAMPWPPPRVPTPLDSPQVRVLKSRCDCLFSFINF